MKLAAEHPDATDPLALALLGHIDRGSTGDRKLLEALLLLLGEGTELEGVDALAALEDIRALPPLIQAVHHPNLPVGLAAIERLGALPGARTRLERWLLDPSEELALRVAIAQALATSEDPRAVDVLVDALRQRGLPMELRQAIRSAVERNHPGRAHELREEVSRDGTPWSTATGAMTLGYTLAVAGQSSSPDLTQLAAGTGTLAGGTVAYLLAQGFPTEAGDAAFVTTTSLAGGLSGYAIGSGLAPDDREIALWTGLAGELTGLSAGLLLDKRHPGTEADAIEGLAVGAATGVLLAGALEVGAQNGLSDPDRTRALDLGAGLGLLGGTILGHAIAPNIDIQRNDWALIALATGGGIAIGQFAPLAGNERGPLPWVGGATGLLAGYAMAGSIDPDWDALGSGGAGAVFGGLVLGGTVLWVRPDDRELIGAGVLLGGIAGVGLGGLLADLDQDPIDDRDVVLTTLTAGWTAAHVLAINNRMTGDILAHKGPLLVVPALSGAAVSGLSARLDVPITHSTAGLTLGLWGAYLGATTGAIAFDDPIVPGLIGGDVGLLVGAIALSPMGGVSPTTVALADGGGILGGASGLVFARAFTRDRDLLLAASIAGATGGFLSGALVGRQLRRSGQTRNIAWSPPDDLHWSVMPTLVGRETLGMGLVVVGW